METITVIAKSGQSCPKELSREVISDSVPVPVPNTSYYRRLVAEGSLIPVPDNATKSPVRTVNKKEKK
jgi:hypothetical protein